MVGLVSLTLFAVGGIFGAQAAVSSPDYTLQSHGTAKLARLATSDTASPSTTTTVSTTTTTTTTTAAPAPVQAPAQAATPPPAPAPAPVATPAPAPAPAASPALPAFGHATTWGCSAAIAYVQAYAAPGFALSCPGYAEGHEAMTCMHDTPQYPNACPSGPTIDIADACPAAYMNESANSWYMTGQLSTEQQRYGVSYAAIDPYGAC